MLAKGIVKQIPTQTSLPDGEQPLVLDRYGAQVMTELSGKYFVQNYNGNLFYGTTTNAGVAIPADNSTAQTFAVWNPAGSNKLLVPTFLRISTVTLGTRVAGGFIFNFMPNAGSAIATGHIITAWTDTVPVCANIGSGHKSAMRFSLSATVTAATSYYVIGMGHELQTTAQNQNMITDFEGSLIVPPNTAMALQMTDAASGSTYAVTLNWMEVPI